MIWFVLGDVLWMLWVVVVLGCGCWLDSTLRAMASTISGGKLAGHLMNNGLPVVLDVLIAFEMTAALVSRVCCHVMMLGWEDIGEAKLCTRIVLLLFMV